MTPAQILTLPEAKSSFATSSLILTIPDITRYITIFLDLITTVNLTETCKTLNQIINQDPRFIFIKCIYITYADDFAPFLNSLNLLKTSRYNYYKIASSNWLLFDIDYSIRDKKEYFRRIYNDPVIIGPKYFNEIYADNYYNRKYYKENYYRKKWYELGLDKLIQYYKHNGKYCFPYDQEFTYLPPKSLAKFENTEFAKKFKILATDNPFYPFSYEYYPNLIEFEYNDITGRFNKINVNNNYKLIVEFNYLKFCHNTHCVKLFKKLKIFLHDNMQITDTEAVLFANFIINKTKIHDTEIMQGL